MSDTVKAVLIIKLIVECPECEHEFDLFDSPQNEEGQLHKQVIDDDRWSIDADERLKTHAYCPNCSVEFDVKGVIW